MNLDGIRRLVEACRTPDFFFVNIGANDGVTNDPIHPFLDEYGWRGLAVEPDPDVFETLRANYQRYPHVVLERAAIVREPAPLFRIGAGPFDRAPWMTQISAVSEARVREVVDLLRRHEGLGPIPDGIEHHIERIAVPCLTFQDLVARHAVDRIDYLNIDTEGSDLEVLDQVDLDRFGVRLLCVEMDLARDPHAAVMDARLRQLGFIAHPDLMLFSVFYLRRP